MSSRSSSAPGSQNGPRPRARSRRPCSGGRIPGIAPPAPARNEAGALYRAFLDRLRAFRVLDPACGSGNFLYLALLALKDIEHRVAVEAEALGLPREFPRIGPEAVKGIEINPYAAELARVTVWIGEIQWMRRNGFDVGRNPILKPLDTIECRDAIVNGDGSEAEWPAADVVIGNPPFLGDREHLSVLGNHYTEALRRAYQGRVPGRADLVVYLIRKAAEKVVDGNIRRVGLVATKSIARGASRSVLDFLSSHGHLIFEAWTNEPWVVEGAAVRVSTVCACEPDEATRTHPRLNGVPVSRINPDLTSGIDVTLARQLLENANIAYQGVKLTGPFDLTGDEARRLLMLPLNPNGRSNSDVIARLYDIDDALGRDSDRWTIDFGFELSECAAALYEEPFRIVIERVIPFRGDPKRCRSTERR